MEATQATAEFVEVLRDRLAEGRTFDVQTLDHSGLLSGLLVRLPDGDQFQVMVVKVGQ